MPLLWLRVTRRRRDSRAVARSSAASRFYFFR
jgi:hypothetical protein